MVRAASLMVLAGAFALAAAAPPRSGRAMLVLVIDQPGRPFAQLVLDGIQSELRNEIGLTTYVEFLGSTARETPTTEKLRADLFAARYSGQPIEAIVAIGDGALGVAERLRQERFPGAGVFFVVIARESAQRALTQGDGFLFPMNPAPSVKMAMQALPALERIFVISGTSALDNVGVGQFRESLATLPRRVPVEYLQGLTLPELRLKGREIPPNSLVVLTANFVDRSGRATNNVEQATTLSEVTASPIVEASDVALGHGVLGGDTAALGRTGEELGKRVRQGLATGAFAGGVAVNDAPRRRWVDWRQWRQMGLQRSQVPAGFEVLNWEPTFWEQHGGKVAGGVALLLLQAVLISFLLAERRHKSRVQARMARQLRLEAAIARTSAGLSGTEGAERQEVLKHLCEELGSVLRVDRIAIWTSGGERATPRPFHSWASNRAMAGHADLRALSGFLHDAAAEGKEIVVNGPADFPAGEVGAALRQEGLASLLSLPLQAGQDRAGWLALGSVGEPAEWSVEILSTLRVLAGMLAQVAIRATAEARARRSEDRTQAMLASLPGFVVMVDGEGTIIRVNEHARHSMDVFPKALAGARPGVKLMELWRDEPGLGREIEALRTGASESLVWEHRYEAADGLRWLEVRGERLNSADAGAVVSHVDITGRKRLESENSSNRETIWHLNRVASMGELTASLAHEINQPLAGILSSAEAAAALLAMPSPDVEEAREAIADIIEDDRRAGSVIERMRSMLKRRHEGTQAVDLNRLARETLRLLTNEARLRQIPLRVDLAPDLPPVSADPTQLQQVLVNLVTNAIEAVEHAAGPERKITVRTRECPGGGSLEVEDCGPGLPADMLKRVFEPFVTTKSKGLGLGLSICASIVDSFGGRITAENVPEGGALFRVCLPEHAAGAGGGAQRV